MNISTTTPLRALATGLAVSLIAASVSSCGFIPIGGGSKVKSDVKAEYVPRGKNLNIWFVKEEAGNLELTAVSRPKIANDALNSALEELLQGPDNSDYNAGIGTEIPRGTILLGVKRKDGVVEVNLSKRFAAGGGPTSLETRLQQLARTVKDIEGNNVDVFVNIEGERLTASSADGLEIAQPITITPEFN